MNATQIAYATAKSLVETLEPTSASYWPAFGALITAENAMIEWAHNVIKTDPKIARRYSEVAIVFEKGARRPAIRHRLIDLCFRLAA